MGTDLYMPGLLANEDEIGTNVPQARFGNLSAFAKDRMLSKQGNGVRLPVIWATCDRGQTSRVCL
jgi:hypothetical protein